MTEQVCRLCVGLKGLRHQLGSALYFLLKLTLNIPQMSKVETIYSMKTCFRTLTTVCGAAGYSQWWFFSDSTETR